jgi:hypothetical protein
MSWRAALVVVPLMIALPRAVAGQEWFAGGFGAVAGANLVGDDVPDPRWGPRRAAGSGAIVEFWPFAHLGARLEVSYLLRGTHFRDDDELFEQRSAYLQLPLLLVMGAGVGSRLRLRGLIGPSIAFLLRCHIVSGFRPLRSVNDPEPTFLEFSQNCNVGLSNYATRHTDVGLLVGGGAAVGFGRVRLVVEGRFDRGLRSIVPAQYDLDVRNTSLGVLLGILCRL